MIRAIMPMFIWSRIVANNKAQKKISSVWKTYEETGNKHYLIVNAFTWVESSEGPDFWVTIHNVLKMSATCTEEKLKAVFIKHGIKI